MTGNAPRAEPSATTDIGREGKPVNLPPGIDRTAILLELDRICNSPALFSCLGLQKFLRHVVEVTLAGQGHQLKEYSIATSILGRRQDFDPRTASIVRTQAGRLRRRLEIYYRDSQFPARVEISLRPGSYVPIFLPGKTDNQAQDLANRQALIQIEGFNESLHAIFPNGTGFVVEPLIEQMGDLLKLDLSLRRMQNGKIETSESATIDPRATDATLATAVSGLYERISAHFRIISTGTKSPHLLSAMRACVEGDLLVESFQDSVLSQAGICYERATRIAPNYAPAFAGRAYLYTKQAILGYDSAISLGRLAQVAADRSMELRPLAPRSLAALGAFTATFEWNLTRAALLFQQAESIVPHDAWTSAALALLILLPGGVLSEAEIRITNALDLDSQNPTAMLAQALLACQRYQLPEAVQLLGNYLAAHPQCGFGHLWLWKVFFAQNRLEESAASLECARNFSGLTPNIRAALILQKSSKRLANDLLKFDLQGRNTAFERAIIHAGRGESEEALNALQQSIESRSSSIMWIRSEPSFFFLRTDARFRQLLEAFT